MNGIHFRLGSRTWAMVGLETWIAAATSSVPGVVGIPVQIDSETAFAFVLSQVLPPHTRSFPRVHITIRVGDRNQMEDVSVHHVFNLLVTVVVLYQVSHYQHQRRGGQKFSGVSGGINPHSLPHLAYN